MEILIIEDEARMRDLLRNGLREHGHTVMGAADGSDGLALAAAHSFDIILLDVMMPGIDGWQVMRRLRENQCTASVLMLTARDAEPDVIRGLNAGADDYLTKPFSFRELLARISSLGRARLARPKEVFILDTLVLDFAKRAAYRGDKTISLTRTEFDLLASLAKCNGQPMARAALIDAVWGQDPSMSRGNLDSFISLLRKKVDLPAERRLVQTVKGVGYMLGLEEQPLRRPIAEIAQ